MMADDLWVNVRKKRLGSDLPFTYNLSPLAGRQELERQIGKIIQAAAAAPCIVVYMSLSGTCGTS